MTTSTCWIVPALSLCIALSAFAQPITLQPEAVAPAIADKQLAQPVDRVHLTGFVGTRIAANEAKRLLVVNEEELLAGFRQRPGKQAWIGEHVGKWMHAATLAWANTGDPKLREKLDRVVADLIKTQEPDGYLGTYTPETRFGIFKNADWDVWVHKYNLMGLITYHRYTGNAAALAAAKKIGDLLCNTFGEGKKSLVKSGTHVGMAPSSVLEPMVLLYRLTGDKKYLDFCKYVVASWDQPGGPAILSSLAAGKGVDKTANGKAYEMMSCLVGVCELYRTTGDPTLLTPVLNAWKDVQEKRLYITGSASQGEHFGADYALPNAKKNIQETCVTVTWEQLNAQLLRLTGECRFAEELEKTVYNQLLGAQKCDGSAWGYYVELEGKKPYGTGTNCCLSSGPRGVALIPTFAITTDGEGVVINCFDSGKADLTLADGTKVGVEVVSDYPAGGNIAIILHPAQAARFALKVRVPAWYTGGAQVTLNGEAGDSGPPAGQYAAVPPQEWKDGDKLEIKAPALTLRMLAGTHTNDGKAAALYGPLVLAFDEGLNPGVKAADVSLPAGDTIANVKTEPLPEARRSWAGERVFVLPGRVGGQTTPLRFVPFAAAGGEGAVYQVWVNKAP